MKPVGMLLGLGVCGLAGALGAIPWTLRGMERRLAIAAEMSRAIGLDVRVGGPIKVKLLPRPRLQLAEVSIKAKDGSVDLSAPTLTGDLDLAAFLRGRWRLVSATLSTPTAVVDIDRSGQSLATRGPNAAAPFRFTVRSGVFRLVSQRLGADSIVSGINGSVERSGGGTGLSVNGEAVWRGVPGQFTLQLGDTSGEAAGRHASAYVRITSPAGSLAATGDVSEGSDPRFTGRLAASSAAPERLFGALGLGPFWINMRRISLNGEAVAKIGDVSLSEASLRVNATDFEGTLGYHADNGRSLVEGTLATDRLDIEALAGREVDGATLEALYRDDIAPRLANTNLDLRLSANQVTVAGTSIEDVALSLLCHERRLEATLDEAVAFGGTVKAHLVGSLLPKDIKAQSDLALSGVDLGELGFAITGQERMTGALTGKIAVEGHGRSLRDIIPTLAGEGQIAVENGNFIGISVSQALKRFTRRLPFGADRPGQVTAFAAASSTMRISGGRVNFIDGKVTGPGMSLAFAGHGDLPQGKVDIVALASPTDAAGTPIAGAPGLPLEMRGIWGEPLMLVEQSRRLPLPDLSVPDIGADGMLP